MYLLYYYIFLKGIVNKKKIHHKPVYEFKFIIQKHLSLSLELNRGEKEKCLKVFKTVLGRRNKHISVENK